MKWLIVAAVVYVLVPWDLIPDLLGLTGRIDDLLIVLLLAWRYRDVIMQSLRGDAGDLGEDLGSGKSHGPAPTESAEPFDAYVVLGVTPTSSADAIQAAYRARMMEYHPDKVAHLGVELQKLAHEKSQAIERAYRQLRK